MTDATDFMDGQKARKRRQLAGKRGLSAKQKASSLFLLWHNIQDIKAEAEQMRDEELTLLVGMVELLVEERTAGLGRHGAQIAAGHSARPN